MPLVRTQAVGLRAGLLFPQLRGSPEAAVQVQGAWKTLTSPPQEPREFPRLCRGGLGLPLAVVGGAWTPPGGLCHRRCKALTGGYSRPWDMYGPSSLARGDLNACGRTHVLTTQPTVPSSSWVLPFHQLALSPQGGTWLVPEGVVSV